MAFLALAVMATRAPAERPPLRTYTLADGLAGERVLALFEDSRGFLWIGTSSGLSRFGGQLFRSYEVGDGLPSPGIDAIVETRDGAIWVGTEDGAARLDPDLRGVEHGARFVSVPLPSAERSAVPATPNAPNPVHGLWVDRRGRLWLASRERWFVAEPGTAAFAGRETPRELPLPPGLLAVSGLVERQDGSTWIGGQGGLVRCSGDVARLEGCRLWATDAIVALATDPAGRLWAASADAIFVLAPETPAGGAVTPESLLARARRPVRPGEMPVRPDELLRYDAASGVPSPFVYNLAPGRDGMWSSTRGGACRIGPTGVQVVAERQGLPEAQALAVLEDREGTLWIGTDSRGLTRSSRSGWVSYDAADGLDNDRLLAYLDDASGALLALERNGHLALFDRDRFRDVTPRALLEAGVPAAWGWNQMLLRDRRRRLWIPTSGGLFRFPAGTPFAALAAARPEARFSRRDGMPGDDIFRVYEDRAGDVWVSMIADPPLVRLAGGERPIAVPEVRGVEGAGAPTAFAEDAAGALWMGFYVGGLARRDGDTWRFFGREEGVPPGFVADLHVDTQGRLWIATTSGGVARIDDPTAPRLRVTRFSAAEGLTTDSARCFAAEGNDVLWIGTSRGLDRLEIASGKVRSFSTADGLPNNVVHLCHATRDGELWFGTPHGAARLDPRRLTAPAVPRLMIAGLRVAGSALPVPELGAARIEGLTLEPGQAFLEVDLEAVGLGQGARVRVQHRFGTGAWSLPVEARNLYFPHLDPGEYALEMRAVGRDGVASSATAELAFRVLPPLWSRPSVRALAVALLVGAAWLVMRARAARLVAVERARTRIAADLHDDVGAGLSRIGILGDLAQHRLAAGGDELAPLLDQIRRETAELADSASEIVWSVDPHRDDLGSLLARLRRFAADLLESRGIALRFSAPEEAAATQLRPEVRRALYLLLKEAIHNAAKHSRASRVEVTIRIDEGELAAEVRDDGVGIPADRPENAEQEGRRGLPGMRARARALGGHAEIDSGAGRGTRIAVWVPLRRAHGRAKPGFRAS